MVGDLSKQADNQRGGDKREGGRDRETEKEGGQEREIGRERTFTPCSKSILISTETLEFLSISARRLMEVHLSFARRFFSAGVQTSFANRLNLSKNQSREN
jgi:hypothetical protein